MSVYDKNGNEISSSTSTDDVKQLFLELVANGEINMGSAVGATLVTNLTNAWITNATTAYNSLLSAYREKPNVSVPFFISTDQHGQGTNLEQHRWLNNTDVDGMNLANINLGDTVYDYYAESILTTAFGRTKQVKNYVSVIGNHDKNYHSGGDDVDELMLNKCFMSTYRVKKAKVTQDCYVAYDDLHSVKYICIDNYILASNKQSWSRGWSTGIATWILDELQKNDGYDIIVCVHFPMHPKHRLRSESEETATQSSAENYNSAHQMACWNLVIARKNKTSGTFTDMDGITHSYDFTECENELLCILSGHAHEERISTSYGITDYTSDWYGNNQSCIFGLIDRSAKKLHIWQFSSTTVYDELVLDI